MLCTQILFDLYEYYEKLFNKDKSVGILLPGYKSKEPHYVKAPFTLFEVLLNDDSFSQKIGVNFYSRELSYEDRYNIWFIKNYETGMEYDTSNRVDFNNPYYEYTPKELLVISYDGKSYNCYR